MTGYYPNGDDADGNIPPPYGWLDLLFRIRDADGSLPAAVQPICDAHRHVLEDEAARYGFTPWFQGLAHPRGRAYRVWRSDFVTALLHAQRDTRGWRSQR